MRLAGPFVERYVIAIVKLNQMENTGVMQR